MKKVLVALVFSTLTITGAAFAQTPPAAVPPPAPEAIKPAAVHHLHHPEIHRAMHRLNEAKDDLQKAAHDYGGHRVKAIEAIDHALVELKEALTYEETK